MFCILIIAAVTIAPFAEAGAVATEAGTFAAETILSPLETEAICVAQGPIAQRAFLATNQAIYSAGMAGEFEFSIEMAEIAGGLYNGALATQAVLRGVFDNMLDSIIPPIL